MPGTEVTPEPVTVLDRVLGVELVVAEAPTGDLAAYLSGLVEIRGMLADEEALVQREILARLDRQGRWTERIGRYTLKAPSPTAGTDDYALDLLKEELLAMIDRKAIDVEAARAALKRTVTVTMTVDVGADLGGLRDAATRTTAVGGVKVYDVVTHVSERVQAAGVNRLKKIGGQVAEGVARAKRPAAPPVRKVKVDVESRSS